MGDRRGRPVEQKMLDVGNDPHRHPRPVGPAQRRAIDDGRIGKAIVLLGRQRRLEHFFVSLACSAVIPDGERRGAPSEPIRDPGTCIRKTVRPGYLGPGSRASRSAGMTAELVAYQSGLLCPTIRKYVSVSSSDTTSAYLASRSNRLCACAAAERSPTASRT